VTSVDRERLEHNLMLVEHRVAQARALIEHQRRIVAELERDGHDAELARNILATFEQLLELLIQDRQRRIDMLDRATCSYVGSASMIGIG
jgi:hypothetical protein